MLWNVVSYIKEETHIVSILRRIIGPEGYENQEWRRFQNYQLDSLYRSPSHAD